jgi:hypothetical protein
LEEALLYKLTQQEQLALMIGAFSIILIILETQFFSINFMPQMLFLGGITIGISSLIIYIFVIQPMNSDFKRIYPYNRQHISKSDYFRPTIIPPSRNIKKTVMKGSCNYCGEKTLMGFTCSYCGGYFCPEHRLPEKHGCMRIKDR